MALFDSFQVTYNVFEQSCFEQLQRIKESGKLIIIKEGLANGRVFLSSKPLELLSELASKYKVGVDAIALRFVMDSLDHEIVLSGASEAEHLKANLKARDFKLNAKELELLRKIAMLPGNYWSERSALAWQ